MGVKVEEGGRTAASDLKRVRSMPPWEVKILSCGPCECIHKQSPSPSKRPKECLKADGETAIQSILHTTVHAEHTVPYKKRKVKLSFVKKSVKFSPLPSHVTHERCDVFTVSIDMSPAARMNESCHTCG
jgi:hypothetical protein